MTGGADTGDELERLMRAVNAADRVQPGWYHRNHAAYELVSYVNNATALFLAGNTEAVPAFLDRAYGYLEREDAARLPGAYRALVVEYLAALARAVAADGMVSERSLSFIPTALLPER